MLFSCYYYLRHWRLPSTLRVSEGRSVGDESEIQLLRFASPKVVGFLQQFHRQKFKILI